MLSVAPCCRGNENKILMSLRACVRVPASEEGGWWALRAIRRSYCVVSSRACVLMVGCTDCLRDWVLHMMFFVEAEGKRGGIDASGGGKSLSVHNMLLVFLQAAGGGSWGR